MLAISLGGHSTSSHPGVGKRYRRGGRDYSSCYTQPRTVYIIHGTFTLVRAEISSLVEISRGDEFFRAFVNSVKISPPGGFHLLTFLKVDRRRSFTWGYTTKFFTNYHCLYILYSIYKSIFEQKYSPGGEVHLGGFHSPRENFHELWCT